MKVGFFFSIKLCSFKNSSQLINQLKTKDRNARPELTDAEANALFAQRAQSIKYPFAKYGLPITAVHSNLLPSNEPTEDRYVSFKLETFVMKRINEQIRN